MYQAGNFFQQYHKESSDSMNYVFLKKKETQNSHELMKGTN